jgi:Xaa-Pro dipeptidase
MTSTATGRAAEVHEKLDRVRDLLDRRDLDGALFTGQQRVAWVTAGVEDPIIRNFDPGFVWALVTRDGAYIITQNVEGPRILAEEGPDEIGFEVATFGWHEDRYAELASELAGGEARLGNDGAGPGTDIADDLQQLRLQLTPGEIERYRVLGPECCAGLEDAVRSVKPGMTEADVAAEIDQQLDRKGIFVSVLLVGADKRHFSWRHPAVKQAKVTSSVLAVIVGIRGGLHVAATRTATIGEPDPELATRHAAACEVEANMIEASRPGNSWGQALQAGIDAYERLGYHDEWRYHYQGGPIGYAPREFGPAPLAFPNAFTDAPVLLGGACAWNPTVQGAKSEDTFLIGEQGPEMISNSEDWPAIEVPTQSGTTMSRPGLLVLGA